MKRLSWFFLPVLFFYSCDSSGPGLFGKRSPHEQYGRKLAEAGLAETFLGRKWFSAAETSLAQPLSVTLPYRQVGYFAADKPRAIGLQFEAKRGEKLSFRLEKNPQQDFVIYTELWRRHPGEERLTLLESPDTLRNSFVYEADDDQTLILRLQPELLNSGSYTLSISVGPSLSFPVPGRNARIGSLWGAPRDAGARSHQGIDIFAPKRTPVIASANGTIHRVEETSIGGKVVWLRPKGKNLALYYAHLDEQLVQRGQKVRIGDTLGFVGNTGNARTTPPHLHFGIYGFGGAIDPLPFVNPMIKNVPAVPVKTASLNRFYRMNKDVELPKGLILKRNTIVFLTGAEPDFYLVELPDGTSSKLSISDIQNIDNQIDTEQLKHSILLLDKPVSSAPVRKVLQAKDKVDILGYFNNYVLVETPDGEMGWIGKALLR